MTPSSLWRIAVRHGASRIAIGLAVAHVLLFLVTVFSRPPLPAPATEPCISQPGEACIDLWDLFGIYLAGRHFHGGLINLLVIVDLPAVAIVDLLPRPFPDSDSTVLIHSYVDAALWLSLGTFQW